MSIYENKLDIFTDYMKKNTDPCFNQINNLKHTFQIKKD